MDVTAVVVAAWVTTWLNAGEFAAGLFESPRLAATIECVPSERDDVVKVATPLAVNVPEPMVVEPSLKLTVPVGDAAAGDGCGEGYGLGLGGGTGRGAKRNRGSFIDDELSKKAEDLELAVVIELLVAYVVSHGNERDRPHARLAISWNGCDTTPSSIEIVPGTQCHVGGSDLIP
jgi:hypothetical protein